jgi:hypothetical protein
MSKGNSPAFPCQDSNKNIYTGMNLRDYFALEAMHGILENSLYTGKESEAIKLSKNAYKIADAMLDERLNYK